ncbi:hypothetical protein HDA40_005445 [Hamadaea flava]|uniref:Leucine rich repeat (LRR) protein n=1 Tax=Hamadaea flava TaxID=1742688 RepID=A0ABV8M2J5_9ACTN|nr:hypothetical protein [Hamadaea flava]
MTQLLTDIDDGPADVPASRHELFTEFFISGGFRVDLIRLAATHHRPGVRRAAAGSFGALDESTQNALLADVAEEVRQAAAASVAYDRQIMRPDDLPELRGHTYFMVLQRTLSPELARQVAAGDDMAAIEFVAGNRTTPPDVVEALLVHSDVAVRRAVAKRQDLTEEQLTRLIADPDVAVRTEVSAHPSLTEPQRALVDIDVDSVSSGDFGPASGNVRVSLESRWSDEDVLRWARSVNPLLRRQAAYDSRLPLDVVLDLANDADLGVRTILAFHHPEAPPESLLRCYLEYRGRGRAQLIELPQFPTAGLAHYAEDPDPTLRQLAPRDPDADPLLVERLVIDPEPPVRQAAAAGPRLPIARLVALLGDPELAEVAATNPSLPVSEMRRILTPGSSSGTAGPGRPGS